MKRLHLLNSAVMTTDGYYSVNTIPCEEFVKGINDAIVDGYTLKHYIGYKSTLTYTEHLLGIDLGGLCRDKVTFKPDERFYIIRLKQRVNPEDKKTDNPDIEDFEFLSGVYTDDWRKIKS